MEPDFIFNILHYVAEYPIFTIQRGAPLESAKYKLTLNLGIISVAA